MFSKIVELLKAILGLSSIAYISGFVIVNSYLLSFGVSDLGILEVSYISAGIIFIFFVISAIIFPYLSGIESFNAAYYKVMGKYLSEEFQGFYINNQVLLKRKLGPFVILIFFTVLLPDFHLGQETTGEMWRLIKVFTFWYLGASIFSRLAVILFNLSFYWKLKMVIGKSSFWNSFRVSFINSFRKSFKKSYKISHGAEPSQQIIDEQLNNYIFGGLSSKGFLASSLYKGIAVLIISAITFGLFLYPLLPHSIGGGRPTIVNLIIPEEESIGLIKLGIKGEYIENNQNNKFLISSAKVIIKTSSAFYLLINDKNKHKVIELPLSFIDTISYGEYLDNK